MTDIHIYHTSTELYKKAAEIFLRTGAEALDRRGTFSVALSGGSTPIPLYQYLADNPLADSLDWNHTHFFWGDERTVSPDHPQSNFREAFKTLLEPRAVPLTNIHRIEGEHQPAIASQAYEENLLAWFGEIPPRFDLILLGLGSDGHTASLFPGTNLVETSPEQESAWVSPVYVPSLESWRITFTTRLINAAANILFLVRGADKARALSRVINGPSQPDTFPAQLIKPDNGQLIWLIDQDASAELGH